MTNVLEMVALVLQAANGEIVGRIRFQKIFYLLEQLGMRSGVAFSYHHYGPFSEDVSFSLDFASLPSGPVKEEKKRISDNYYSVYSINHSDFHPPRGVGTISWEKMREYVQIMKSESSMVLEIAATIHWLKTKENVSDWETELKNRKGSKAENLRIQKANDLLRKLGLGDNPAQRAIA